MQARITAQRSVIYAGRVQSKGRRFASLASSPSALSAGPFRYDVRKNLRQSDPFPLVCISRNLSVLFVQQIWIFFNPPPLVWRSYVNDPCSTATHRVEGEVSN